MRLAAQVLSLALLPAMAAAQGSPSAGAAGDRGIRSESDTTAPRERDASRPAACSWSTARPRGTTTATADRSEADSTTDALIAALCARAGQPASLGTVRHVLSIPRDVGNTPRDEHGDHADAAAADPRRPAEPQFRVHLFGDVKFSAIDSTRARNGFALGQFDLFGQSQLSDRLSVLTEATLTALPRNTFNARLERLLVTYWASDRFIASAGRYHSSIGYYNTAYHHGSWFQTAVGRPIVFALDGDIGLLPTHTLGVATTGDIPSVGWASATWRSWAAAAPGSRRPRRRRSQRSPTTTLRP